jgi:uncharacterized protein YbaP (TraB family)
VGRPEFLDFATPVDAAFASATELVVEVDLASISQRELAQQMSRYVMLSAGESLRDRISPATYAALADRVAESGMSMDAIERMKPWAAATVLEMSQFAAAGLEEAYGVDRYFVEKAQGRLAIRGLETFESQSQAFDGLSWDLQELMLADSIAGMDEDPGDVVDAWARGDEAALTRQIMEPLEIDPRYGPFYEAVFFARNETMAADLEILARDGRKRFVVVGAGHLLGPRGIPALLSARGFRVERVPDR